MTGFYVPSKIVTNDDLAKLIDTSDEWIQERTGIKQRHYAADGEGPADMAKIAAERAIADAGMTNRDIDMIVFATLNPDICFPGSGCVLQSIMDFGTIPAIDIREQCSGFIYSLAVADRFIRTDFCKNVLVVGAENHSSGLDFTDRGRDVTVIFGDGAGAVVMGPANNNEEGMFDFSLHAQGEHYDKLMMPAPYGKFEGGRITHEMIDKGEQYPVMDGRTVFKHAIPRFCEAMNEVLEKTGHDISGGGPFHSPSGQRTHIKNGRQKNGHTLGKCRIKHTQVWEHDRRYYILFVYVRPGKKED